MNTAKPDPWKKTSLSFEWKGQRLDYDIPHDVFSTQWIDDGTRLLLDHLPGSAPRSFLDLGCGYGALGLPVARLYPDAVALLVDRDLLAVKWSARNAFRNRLPNVRCIGSLGFDSVESGQKFDWILCNVPARIGAPFMKMLLEGGNDLLNPDGELRMVIIRDLLPLLERTAEDSGLALRHIATGPRHSILGLVRTDRPVFTSDPDLYLRDRVEVEGIRLDRPFDLGGDDPKRLRSILPLFLETLPRNPSPELKRILCVKCAYGALPLLCHKRWPGAAITTFDRDLLGVRFTKRNIENVYPSASITVLESPGIEDLTLEPGSFDLITYEVSPSIGSSSVWDDLNRMHPLLTGTGCIHIIAHDRSYREFLQGSKGPGRLTRIAGRDGLTVLQLTR
jgi:16S rRNA (guanine1207-N2)-methyltransferase